MTEHDRTADDAAHPEPLIAPAGPAPAGDESAEREAAPAHPVGADEPAAPAHVDDTAGESESVTTADSTSEPTERDSSHTEADRDATADAPAHAEHETSAFAPSTAHDRDTAAVAAAPAATPAPERVVYVPTPQPPRKRGARGVGVGVALASSLIFTVLYALLAALFISIGGPTAIAERVQVFAATPSFWMPVIAFTIGYLLLVLIVNRAGWWAHVLGGFLVAALVYVVFIASTVLSAQAVGAPPQELQQFLLLQITNPLGWAAAIAAREVPIWVGGLVARRGRTAKARNVEARETYERELAEARATGGDRAV